MTRTDYILQTVSLDFEGEWDNIFFYKTKEEGLKEYEEFKHCKRKVRLVEVTTKVIGMVKD